MTDLRRRDILRTAAMGTALAVAAGAGLLQPRRVLAAWPAKVFDAKDRDSAVKALFGTSTVHSSDKISFNASPQAEDGSSVPVSVTSNIPGTDAIAVLVHENIRPMTAWLKIGEASPYFRLGIKMAKSSKVEFVVRAGGKLYSASTTIKVTAGGCGG